MAEIDVMVRKPLPADTARILREWLTSFKRSRYAGCVPNDRYKQIYADCIRQLLERGATLLVACNAAAPEIILGFVCTEHTPRDKIVHYVFVREQYRQCGVGRMLLDAAGILKGCEFVYTFRTGDSKYIMGHSSDGTPLGRHMPELARRQYAYKADPSQERVRN